MGAMAIPILRHNFYSNDSGVILACSHFPGISSLSQSSLNAGISSRSQFSSGSSEEASILVTLLSVSVNLRYKRHQHILPVVAFGLPSTTDGLSTMTCAHSKHLKKCADPHLCDGSQ